MAGDRSRKLSFSATSVRESRPSGALNFSPAISSASFPFGVAPRFSTVHLTIKNIICTASLIAMATAKYNQKQNQRISLLNYDGKNYNRATLVSRMEDLKSLKISALP